jgi:hypothetical protein
MPRIFVLSGPDVGLQAEVAPGAVLGRGDECALRLRDPSISRQHARIEGRDGGLTLVDLGSRNGIAAGGARTTAIPLTHGAEFVVGAVRMRFTDEPAAAVPSGVEEILLDESPADAPAAGPKASRSTPEVGAARRRALANKEGIQQFERIESQPASLLRDDLGQYGPFVKLGLTLAALALAGALGFAAFKIATAVTPEGGEAAGQPPAEVK